MASSILFEKLLRGGYRATLGPFSECGKTKTAAQSALFETISSVPSNTDPVVRKTAAGDVWVLWFEGRGWIYRRSDCTSCVMVNGDKATALGYMDKHIAQLQEQG